MKRCFSMKKLAVGVSSALCVAGMQQVSADAIMFPYVVNGPTVTTILSAINTADNIDNPNNKESLHFIYRIKSQLDDLGAKCYEDNFYNPTSVADVVTFEVGQSAPFGDTKGVLFEDPAASITYNQTFKRFPTPSRGFVIVENNDHSGEGFIKDTQPDGTLYGEALILDFKEGAAWGYRAYNPASGGRIKNALDFTNHYEVQGEVLRSAAALKDWEYDPAIEWAATEFYPGDEFVQKLTVTPIDTQGDTWDDTYSNQNKPDITAVVGLTTDKFVSDGDLRYNAGNIYDRDELPTSGTMPKTVTCVAAIDVNDMFYASSGAQNVYRDFGGWSIVRTAAPAAANDEGYLPSKNQTNQAVVMKVAYNKSGTVGGSTVGGILNTNVWLMSRRSFDDFESDSGNSGNGIDLFPVFSGEEYSMLVAKEPADKGTKSRGIPASTPTPTPTPTSTN